MLQYVYVVINSEQRWQSMSKNNNPLYKALQDHTRKRISLEELNRICQDHEQLAQQISELTEQGILTPVKSSGTNGNLKIPLYMRYTISIEKERSRRDIISLPLSYVSHSLNRSKKALFFTNCIRLRRRYSFFVSLGWRASIS